MATLGDDESTYVATHGTSELQVFLAYCGTDEPVDGVRDMPKRTKRALERLKSRGSVKRLLDGRTLKVFLDEDSNRGGKGAAQFIEAAAQSDLFVLFLLSKHGLKSNSFAYAELYAFLTGRSGSPDDGPLSDEERIHAAKQSRRLVLIDPARATQWNVNELLGLGPAFQAEGEFAKVFDSEPVRVRSGTPSDNYLASVAIAGLLVRSPEEIYSEVQDEEARTTKRRVVVLVMLVLALLLLTFAASFSRFEAISARDQANNQSLRARKAESRAEKNERRAIENAERARRDREAAEESAKRAKKSAMIASQSERLANERLALAERRREEAMKTERDLLSELIDTSVGESEESTRRVGNARPGERPARDDVVAALTQSSDLGALERIRLAGAIHRLERAQATIVNELERPSIQLVGGSLLQVGERSSRSHTVGEIISWRTGEVAVRNRETLRFIIPATASWSSVTSLSQHRPRFISGSRVLGPEEAVSVASSDSSWLSGSYGAVLTPMGRTAIVGTREGLEEIGPSTAVRVRRLLRGAALRPHLVSADSRFILYESEDELFAAPYPVSGGSVVDPVSVAASVQRVWARSPMCLSDRADCSWALGAFESSGGAIGIFSCRSAEGRAVCTANEIQHEQAATPSQRVEVRTARGGEAFALLIGVEVFLVRTLDGALAAQRCTLHVGPGQDLTIYSDGRLLVWGDNAGTPRPRECGQNTAEETVGSRVMAIDSTGRLRLHEGDGGTWNLDGDVQRFSFRRFPSAWGFRFVEGRVETRLLMFDSSRVHVVEGPSDKPTRLLISRDSTVLDASGFEDHYRVLLRSTRRGRCAVRSYRMTEPWGGDLQPSHTQELGPCERGGFANHDRLWLQSGSELSLRGVTESAPQDATWRLSETEQVMHADLRDGVVVAAVREGSSDVRRLLAILPSLLPPESAVELGVYEELRHLGTAGTTSFWDVGQEEVLPLDLSWAGLVRRACRLLRETSVPACSAQ